MWWTKWHWDRFFPEFFGFPLSISFHRRSIKKKKPQGCGASVASAAGPFTTKKRVRPEFALSFPDACNSRILDRYLPCSVEPNRGIRAGAWHGGVSGGPIIWCLSNRYALNVFGIDHGWRTFMRARAEIVCNFQRNSLACGNLRLVPPYFRLL
jgi:hypothetical protein